MIIRILLADDSQQYRRVIRSMLERQPDMRIVGEVSDGEAAVAATLADGPDLVLMDIGMPQLDGIAATRRILAERPGARVVALTLHAEAQFVDIMVAAGASGYILKEDPFPELLRAIRAVAAGGTYFSSALPGADGAASSIDAH